MIPHPIIQYLERQKIPFIRHPHPRAVSGQELAAAVHVTGYRVAKAVLVEADGRPLIAVVPVAELLDEERLRDALGAERVSLLREASFEPLFPTCEVGAEPPFGGLFALPVALDASLAVRGPLILRAGSHEESIEIDSADFVRLERPTIAAIARERPPAWPHAEPQPAY